MTGEVTRRADSSRPLTLGTAGHIDHGKTTLVKALTGRDTDRLKEEKERGISIELGFAELTLPSGRHLSVVDVPGHERFVKTMVAGATGIDLFMLVIAADDGVMPQTREHLRIIELLGIPAGVIAITKIDAVEQDMVELARADAEEFLSSTRHSNAPIVEVSGVTGRGLPELLALLDSLADKIPPRPSYPATRMPVDRVFSLKGIGTVVTGTLWSGSLSAEDTVAILPPRGHRSGTDLRDVRVRSVQVHDRQVATAGGGQRVALSLTGVERNEVLRGQWVVKDPTIDPTYLSDVRITYLPDAAGPLPRVSRARVDHGTSEVLAKVVLADREALRPGDSCYAQLRFEERVLVYPGDQFVLRSVTPVTTIGGGRVIDPAPHKHGTGTRWHDRLTLLEEGPPGAIADLLLEESFPLPLSRGRLEASPYLWHFAAAEIAEAVDGLLAEGRALLVTGDRVADADAGVASDAATKAVARSATRTNLHLFHGGSLLALMETVLAAIRAQGERDALNPYLTLGELRREISGGKEWPALDAALERLLAAGEVIRSEHGYQWAGAVAGPDAVQMEIIERLLAQFEGGGIAAATGENVGVGGSAGAGETSAAAPALGGGGAQQIPAETPSVAAAAEAAGLPPQEVQKLVEALVRQGALVRVGEDLYYPPDRLEALISRLVAAMEAAGSLTLAEARDLLGTSRRYAQALLEHMDSEGLTLRVGEARRLRRRRR